MNAFQEVQKSRPLFCAPPKLAVTTEQGVDILERYLRDYNTKGSDFIEPYLLMALEETFPCQPP